MLMFAMFIENRPQMTPLRINSFENRFTQIVAFLFIFLLCGYITPANAQGNSKPETTHTIMLTGTVTDSAGEPLDGVSVGLIDYSRNPKDGKVSKLPVKVTTSTLDGSYSLPMEIGSAKLSPTGIKVDKPGYASVFLLLYELHSPQISDFSEIKKPVVLAASAPVSGRVLNVDGTPLPDIPIIAQSEKRIAEGVMYWPGQTTTDADGNFVLDNVPAGDLKIMATISEGGGIQQVVTAPAKDIVLTAATADAGIKGRIVQLETGLAVTSATVKLQRRFVADNGWLADPIFKEETQTDTNGNFSFEHLRPGTYATYIFADGLTLLDNSESTAGLELQQGETQNIKITMYEGAEITGTVIDAATSEPITGVEVSVDNPGGTPLLQTVTGADGRFSLKPVQLNNQLFDSESIVSLKLKAQGYVLQRKESVQYYTNRLTVKFPARQAKVDQTIKMRKAQVVSGQVFGPDGVPVAKAVIYTRPTMNERHTSNARVAGMTDAVGHFTINIETPKDQDVYVAAPGFAVGQASNINADVPLEIHLAPAATLHGIVVSQDGEPIQGAELHVTSQEFITVPLAMARGTSAPDGTFKLTVAIPGKQRITVNKPSYIRDEATEVNLKPGDDNPAVTIRLKKGKNITGRVVGKNGNPVAGVTVIAGASQPNRDGQTMQFLSNTAPGASARTNSRLDGTFTLEGLRDGVVDLAISTRAMPQVLKRNVQAGATGVELQAPESEPGDWGQSGKVNSD